MRKSRNRTIGDLFPKLIVAITLWKEEDQIMTCGIIINIVTEVHALKTQSNMKLTTVYPW